MIFKKKKIIKEGFGIATQDNSLKDPMFERLGPPNERKETKEGYKFWKSFVKDLNSKITDNNFILKSLTLKGTTRTIVLEGENEEVSEVIIYQDWSISTPEEPITILQIETPEKDIIRRLGKINITRGLVTKVSEQLQSIEVMVENKTINISPKNQGKFTATKKETGKSTEELTHSKNPLTKKRAIFAQNAKKWNHKESQEESLEEKAVSKKQQQFFAIVDEMRKGNIKAKGEAGKVANSNMKTKEIEKFSKTKTKDLPSKIKKESTASRLRVSLLKEKLERIVGRKVILKEGVERVTIDQMNDILSNVPPQEKIALYMITKVNMNKNIIDDKGNKVSNPFYDKVLKKNIVYGRVNFSYSDEYKGSTGTEYAPDTNSKRTLGDKKGAISIKDGKARLPLTDVEYDTPVYEINGNEITKEELKPYLPKVSSTPHSSGVTIIAPYLTNVKKIAIGNKEYQII